MFKKTLFVAGFLLATSAFAQQAAVATQVEGLVTVSQGQLVGVLQPGAPIADGARIITGSTGNAVLNVGTAGCQVPLQPNQMVVIQAGQSCANMIASVQNVATLAGGSELIASSAGGVLSPAMIVNILALGMVGAVAEDVRAKISAQ